MQTVNLGPLSFPLAHLLLVLALAVALLVGGLASRKRQLPVAGALFDIFLMALVSARVVFVLMYFGEYMDNLWSVVDIRDGGFSIVAGIAGALLYTAYLMWRQPLIRQPLGFAVASGLLTWGAVSLTAYLIETGAATLPDSHFQTLSGQDKTLAEVASGKPMVVNLWASWCPPCIREMPVLEAAQQRHPDIRFVFVNQGEQPETVRGFLTQHGLSLDHILTDPGSRLGRMIGSQALPTTLFYDAAGKQVDTHLGALSRGTLARSLEHLVDK